MAIFETAQQLPSSWCSTLFTCRLPTIVGVSWCQHIMRTQHTLFISYTLQVPSALCLSSYRSCLPPSSSIQSARLRGSVPIGGLSRSGGLPGLYRESIRQVAIPGGFYTLYGRLPASRSLLQASNTGGEFVQTSSIASSSGTSRCASIFVTKVNVMRAHRAGGVQGWLTTSWSAIFQTV